MRVLFAWLLLASCALASDYTYCGNGYYYRNRCWYRYSGGRYVYHSATYPSSTDENWRSSLTDIMREGYRAKFAVERSAQEHQEYMEALGVVSSAMGSPGYATYAAGYQGIYGVQYVPNAVQGSAVYGAATSVRQYLDAYATSDIDVQVQGLTRVADKLVEGVPRVVGAVSQVVDNNSSDRSRFIMQRQAHEYKLKELETLGKLRSTETHVETNVTTPAPAPAASAVTARAAEVFRAKCVSCHDGKIPNGKSQLFPGGVNLAQYASFTKEQRAKVLEAVESGKMPKESEPLPPEDIMWLYAAWFESR